MISCENSSRMLGRKLAGFCLLAGMVSGSLGVVSPAAAESSPTVKVALVDLKKALASSKSGAEAQQKYAEEVKKAQSVVDSKKSEFDKLKESYAKQRDSLNEKARQDKEEQIASSEKELKRNFQDSHDKLQRENASIVNDLLKKILTIVDQVGKEQGYTIVLEKGSQSVLYADNSIDITGEVVKRFDATSK